MVRIEYKLLRFGCPDFADVFVGRQASQRFKPTTIVVGIDEVVEMGCQLGMAIIVIAFDGCLLARAIYAFDLAIGPGVLGLSEPVFDIMPPTGAIEGMATPASGGAVAVLGQVGKLDAIIG
jgi:hypothetical protein